MLILTMFLANREESNLSSPSCCLPKLISVLLTVLDFLLIKSVTIITTPASINIQLWVLTGSRKASSVIPSGFELPAAIW